MMLAALAIADRPQLGARMDEEQRVVQAGRERELVALEHQRRRAHDERRQHGGARVVDRDLLDARVGSSCSQRSTSAAGIGAPTCSSPPATSGRTNCSRKSRTCGRAITSSSSPDGSALRSGASGKPHSANRPTASLTTCASALGSAA